MTASLSDEVFNRLNMRASLPSNIVPNGYWDLPMPMDLSQVHRNQRPSSISASQIQPYARDVKPTYIVKGDPNNQMPIENSSSRTRFSRQSSRASRSNEVKRPLSQSFQDSRYSQLISSSAYDGSSLRPGLHRAASWDANYDRPRQPSENRSRPQSTRRYKHSSTTSVTMSTSTLKNKPGTAFKKLPKEVLDLIVKKLREAHLIRRRDGKVTCSTCVMRDLCSVAVVNRQCFNSARWQLYKSVWINGPESPSQNKRLKLKSGGRLTLLRRTLRANSDVAGFVREISFPEPEKSSSMEDRRRHFDLIASVIMACPNLERYLGPIQAYDYQYTRLTQALSSRQKLTEHVWNIEEPRMLERTMTTSRFRRSFSHVFDQSELAPAQGPPVPFLANHINWNDLSSLAIHCSEGGYIDTSTLSVSISKLPALTHLSLSAIPGLPQSFLTEIPPLKSLHLSHLSCLSDQALSEFATTPTVTTITSLSLNQVPLTSLAILARILSNLVSLRSFVFIQDSPPTMPRDTSVFLHPYLASASLKKLTWDVLSPNADASSDATAILVSGLQAGGFPNLQRVKAPCDYKGIIQSLCRPQERIPSPLSIGWEQLNTLDKRKDSGIEGILGLSSLSSIGDRLTRSLRAARTAAQERIESARSKAMFDVFIEDWSIPELPLLVGTFHFGGFVGKIGSNCRIVYDLTEDIMGKDHAGVVVEDLWAYKERAEIVEVGCDGSWNSKLLRNGKKDMRRVWDHEARMKWMPLEVGVMFT